MHVALRGNFSGPVCSIDPVKVSKDAPNLLVCTKLCKKSGACGTERVELPRMQWQIKLPVVTLALGSCYERVENSLSNLSFASFNAPYKPVRLMYEKSS